MDRRHPCLVLNWTGHRVDAFADFPVGLQSRQSSRGSINAMAGIAGDLRPPLGADFHLASCRVGTIIATNLHGGLFLVLVGTAVQQVASPLDA
jgi:hypothetical protein